MGSFWSCNLNFAHFFNAGEVGLYVNANAIDFLAKQNGRKGCTNMNLIFYPPHGDSVTVLGENILFIPLGK